MIREEATPLNCDQDSPKSAASDVEVHPAGDGPYLPPKVTLKDYTLVLDCEKVLLHAESQ